MPNWGPSATVGLHKAWFMGPRPHFVVPSSCERPSSQIQYNLLIALLDGLLVCHNAERPTASSWWLSHLFLPPYNITDESPKVDVAEKNNPYLHKCHFENRLRTEPYKAFAFRACHARVRAKRSGGFFEWHISISQSFRNSPKGSFLIWKRYLSVWNIKEALLGFVVCVKPRSLVYVRSLSVLYTQRWNTTDKKH